MTGRRLLPALALALAAAACGCAREGGEVPPPPRPVLTVLPVALGASDPASVAALPGPVALAEVSATPEAREKGLMGRDTLPRDSGMLFVYPEDRPLGFWMKNCRSPLAAAFIDRGGLILNIEEMAPGTGIPDGSLPRYSSRGDARFVLEMEAGWFSRKGIRSGDRADLTTVLQGVEPR